jgi:hypothetical protein
MTEHVIEAHFQMSLQALQDASEQDRADQLPSGYLWTRHFRNFDMTPDGHIVIRNYSAEFRDKLREVLFDETVPFKAALPLMKF